MKQTKTAVRKITIDPGEPPILRNVLAQSIKDLAQAASNLSRSGLNEKALIVLIAHSSRVSISTVKDVWASIKSLETDYCK